MNIELLGRQAIDRIKSEWGLPKSGFIAGGSIANIVWELVSGNKAIINDVDVFVFDSIQEKFDKSDKSSLFNYQERETKYGEDYTGICFNTYTKDFYSIVESTKDDIFNIVKYKSNSKDPSLIIKSFDINATRIGYSIEKDEIYWTSDFEDFLKTGTLKVTNLMTPSHTAVRIAKKSKELKAKVYIFEFKLLQYALGHNFSDRIKFRFKERYHQMYGEDHLRNLQEETINEDFKEDLIKVLDRDGLETASKLVSGYDNLINLLGDYQIPKKVKIRTIKEYMERIGGVGLAEINQDAIPYIETNTEYQEIVHFGINNVIIDRWGGYKNQTHLGQFPVRYENLTEKTIDDIIEIVLNELPEYNLYN
jgi:hypothetical protein